MNEENTKHAYIYYREFITKIPCYFHSMSSAPYTVKDMRVVGEVPSHDLKSLRSLINIGMFLDLVNAAEKTFEIPLL